MSRQVNQRTEILKALKNGEALSQKDATERYGCRRLAAIINVFRRRGYNIETDMKQAPTMYGDVSRYAEYRLVEE